MNEFTRFCAVTVPETNTSPETPRAAEGVIVLIPTRLVVSLTNNTPSAIFTEVLGLIVITEPTMLNVVPAERDSSPDCDPTERFVPNADRSVL